VSEQGDPPVAGWPAESADRLQRARDLRQRGINPYPNRYDRTHRLQEIRSAYADRTIEELEALAVSVRVAGRVMTQRGQGKASFLTLSDGEAELQLFVRENDVGPDNYALLKLVDRGDFIGAAGQVMRTRAGELSVQARELTFLSKALLPPPEKWHGLTDVEARYRQRYLDLMVNPEVRRTFVARSQVVAEMRRFMDARGYVEVETPMMQPIAGGAVARPFVTHHNALDMELYLRIAPELYLKRLVVGGLEKVYEINRNFRNEGISAMHNPEFTMLEFYTAYHDVDAAMAITEEIVAAAAARVAGEGAVRFKEREVSFARPFKRLTMVEAVAEIAAEQGWGITADEIKDPSGLERWLQSQPRPSRMAIGSKDHEAFTLDLSWPKYRGLSHGSRIAQLFEFHVERRWDAGNTRLWNPTFVTDYPTDISPLAKARPDDPNTTERFELFAAGMEIANGFSELNDPLEQRERFLQQLALREKGDDEAHRMDDDYVRALGHGLPPTGGVGVGIDRLVMILTDSPSIRDVILFPHMRPEAGRP
jgi:lysyl-tRNA synthetase class 2